MCLTLLTVQALDISSDNENNCTSGEMQSNSNMLIFVYITSSTPYLYVDLFFIFFLIFNFLLLTCVYCACCFIIRLMKKFVLVVEITIRMINIAHNYIKIIPISTFKLHSSSSDQEWTGNM